MPHRELLEKEEGLNVNLSQLLLSVIGITRPILGYLAANAIDDLKGQIALLFSRDREISDKVSEHYSQQKVLEEKFTGISNLSSERSSRCSNLEAIVASNANRLTQIESKLAAQEKLGR